MEVAVLPGCASHARTTLRPIVNSVEIDVLDRERFVSAIQSFLECEESHVVHFVFAYATVLARRDTRYRGVMNRGDLNSPDGQPIAWALRLLGRRATRFTGSDGLLALGRWGLDRGIRHYLYGGRPEVVQRLLSRLEGHAPGIQIVGAESPPYRESTDEEMGEAARRIRDAGTDLLWVGLGTPKQDFVAERMRVDGAAPVILSVGAAFDFVSGAVPRAPRWMQRAGLEWLHRVGVEPRRLGPRYLFGHPRFLADVLTDLVHPRASR